jgi:hypothetical protein
MTLANSRSISVTCAKLAAALLPAAALFCDSPSPADAQQTLLEYSQPANQPVAPQQGRYPVQQAMATASPYAANPNAAAGAATPIPGTGNPFLRTGPARSSLLNAGGRGAVTSNGAAPSNGAGLSPVDSRYTNLQPITPASPRYDDQVRPASFDVPPSSPMVPITPSTPAAVVGGPDLAAVPMNAGPINTAPADSRYPAQPNFAPSDTRYAQVPAGQQPSPYGQQPSYTQQAFPPAAQPQGAAVQTAANLPVASGNGNGNGNGNTAAPQPFAGAPQQLSGLAILRQKPLDENAARMQHPLTPLVAWLEDSLRQMDNLRDFSCTFKKREFVDGKLGEQQSMFVKMRMQPHSVYLYFLDPDVRGQEAIYVAGKNGGNLLAHPIGIKQTLVGTLSLAPNDPQAMEGNRYPITDFGFRRLAERYLERCKYEMQFGECEVRVIEGARVNDRVCTCVEIVHPVKRSEFRYGRCRLFIDNEYNLPIRCEGNEWPSRPGEEPPLVEEYTYSNLKLNLGFTDADFDVNNPQYGFK